MNSPALTLGFIAPLEPIIKQKKLAGPELDDCLVMIFLRNFI